MSLNITTKLPLRKISSRTAARCCNSTLSVSKRQFFFKSFWSRSPTSPEHADWTRDIHGPTRASKAEVKAQQEQELKQNKELDDLVQKEPEASQADGEHAKHIEVKIDGDSQVFDTAFFGTAARVPHVGIRTASKNCSKLQISRQIWRENTRSLKMQTRGRRSSWSGRRMRRAMDQNTAHGILLTGYEERRTLSLRYEAV